MSIKHLHLGSGVDENKEISSSFLALGCRWLQQDRYILISRACWIRSDFAWPGAELQGPAALSSRVLICCLAATCFYGVGASQSRHDLEATTFKQEDRKWSYCSLPNKILKNMCLPCSKTCHRLRCELDELRKFTAVSINQHFFVRSCSKHPIFCISIIVSWIQGVLFIFSCAPAEHCRNSHSINDTEWSKEQHAQTTSLCNWTQQDLKCCSKACWVKWCDQSHIQSQGKMLKWLQSRRFCLPDLSEVLLGCPATACLDGVGESNRTVHKDQCRNKHSQKSMVQRQPHSNTEDWSSQQQQQSILGKPAQVQTRPCA